ncbi:MAG: PIN domain-containing protein, partial [Burkholderiales bacterium]
MIQRKPASNVARFPSAPAKLFVLDTNVLMHDPTCLFRFEEHDIYIPMAILEELDNNKKGMSEVARNARQ